MFTLEKKCISYKNTLKYQMLKIPNILCLPHNGLTPLTYMLRLESKPVLNSMVKCQLSLPFMCWSEFTIPCSNMEVDKKHIVKTNYENNFRNKTRMMYVYLINSQTLQTNKSNMLKCAIIK